MNCKLEGQGRAVAGVSGCNVYEEAVDLVAQGRGYRPLNVPVSVSAAQQLSLGLRESCCSFLAAHGKTAHGKTVRHVQAYLKHAVFLAASLAHPSWGAKVIGAPPRDLLLGILVPAERRGPQSRLIPSPPVCFCLNHHPGLTLRFFARTCRLPWFAASPRRHAPCPP